MPFTEAELYILRDFNTLADDEVYQSAFHLLESELNTCATFPIPSQHVIALHEWSATSPAPPATLLFDLHCGGFHYAVQIVGKHLVRVSKVDLTARTERIVWRSKKQISHDYPFSPVAPAFSD